MRTTHNINGVTPFANSNPGSGRALAATISAGVWPEHDPDIDTQLNGQIEEKAYERLEAQEIEAFADFNSAGDRTYYQLENGEVGVHWVAAQFVEAGTVEDLAEQVVSEFRRRAEENKEVSGLTM